MNQNAASTSLSDFPSVIALPVQWGDQDAFGHVNNTVPIRWFESGRIAYLESGGMIALMKSFGLGPILASVTCHYRRQLNFPDTVQIGSRIARIGHSSLIMAHAVFSQSQRAIAADGESAIVMFDYESNRPQRIPDDLRAAVHRFEGRTVPDKVRRE